MDSGFFLWKISILLVFKWFLFCVDLILRKSCIFDHILSVNVDYDDNAFLNLTTYCTIDCELRASTLYQQLRVQEQTMFEITIL